MSPQYGGPVVCDTPANFNGFRVLAALLHSILVAGVSQTAALNRGRHLYSARQPSRWASAHISSLCRFVCHETIDDDHRMKHGYYGRPM